jgi:3-hydroxyisobutyrate dehydrogenase-like beta-hydroxyacid dehydrogenase
LPGIRFEVNKMNNEKAGVGCIGAGVLDGAIMRRLIDCGFAPVVWNRDNTEMVNFYRAGKT